MTATLTFRPAVIPAATAESEAMRRLGERCVHGALTRLTPTGNTPKGRVIAEMRGEMTEGEREFFTLRFLMDLTRLVARQGVTAF